MSDIFLDNLDKVFDTVRRYTTKSVLGLPLIWDNTISAVFSVPIVRKFGLYHFDGIAGTNQVWITPPKGKAWVVHNFRDLLITDAVVSARTFYVHAMRITNALPLPNDILHTFYASASLGLNTTFNITEGFSTFDPAIVNDLVLFQTKDGTGVQFFSGTVLLDAGDTHSINMNYEEVDCQ